MYLQLFDSVHITEGYKRAVIFDTATGFINYIPKSFSSLLCDKNVNYTLLKQELDDESKEALDQYIQFIKKNRLGIILETADELVNFRRSDEKQYDISEIDYFIFDLQPADLILDIVNQINDLGIKFVQLRILENSCNDDIINLFSKLVFFNDTCVNEVSIVLPYDSSLEKCIIEGKIIKSNIYLQFLFHSCEFEEKKAYGNIEILKMKKSVQIPDDCGCINLNNMVISRNFYLEAREHNSCLYKKISIDKEGNIRNCPSMRKSFGNIRSTSLRNAFHSDDFKEYWDVNKDKIEICQDCEFKYICTDCRAYTEKGFNDIKNKDISKPLKCGYDPYSGIWEEWSTNPLKQTAISYYNLNKKEPDK